MLFQMLCGEVPFRGSSIPSIMKKHLTLDVPTLSSKGVEVPPQVEAVIRHALEKDLKYRTPSADDFARELREAMAAASATMKRTGESAAEIDPSKTILSSPAIPNPNTMPVKGSTTAFDPLAGTISAASLQEEENKTLFAQRELAREAQFKRKQAEEEAEAQHRLDDEKEQKRKADEGEREAERRHLEELVAQQTKVLEEKLTMLASTMTPKATANIDPDMTHFQHPGGATMGETSFPGGPGYLSHAGIGVAPKKKSSLPLILGLCALLLIGGGVGGYFILKSKSITPGGPTNPQTPETTKPELVDIPGGEFQMGRNGALPQEGPAHQVTVKGFSMDRTEVTNAEYSQFVRDANYQPPEQWGGIKPPTGEELLPVSNITKDDAVAFAAWRSKRDNVTYRLPTEEEWEYAARNGDRANLYPWGNTWMPGRAATLETGVGKEQAVATYPQGGNRWGVQDLMGNVWELTSSKASLYPGSPVTLPAQNQDWVVVRGGGYSSPANKVSGTHRDWFAPNYRNPVLGFRLVKPSS
jgi:formylglycine-generating enzyme required for sulfatase activity